MSSKLNKKEEYLERYEEHVILYEFSRWLIIYIDDNAHDMNNW